MKKITKRILSLVLALVMVLGCFPTAAMAAETEGRTWVTITGGANNSGGHNYGNGASSGPIFYLDADREMVSGGTISMALKPSGNWGVFYSYIDDSNWLYVGYDSSSKWYYQYKWNGSESYPGISGLPDPVEGEELSLTISLSNETLAVTVNGTTAYETNQTLKSMANALTESNGNLGKFGVMTKGATSISFADFAYDGKDCMKDTWQFCAERDGQTVDVTVTALAPVSGKVTNEAGEAIEGATVRVGVNSTTTDANGEYRFDAVQVGEYSFAVTKPGYQPYTQTITVEDKDDNVVNAVLADKASLDLSSYDTIESEDMTVYVGKEFPVVARYVMKSDETGATFFRGNETALNTVVINGVEITPEVTVETEAEPAAQAEADNNPFTDINTSQYFYNAVLWAVDKEVTNGATDTTFEPMTNCTRGQVVTFLYRAMGSPEVETKENSFKDINASQYYYDAVLWAKEMGITDGKAEGKFAPDDTCTRGEIVTFLHRAKGYPEAETKENPFNDVAATDFYYDAVLWAVENGITDGTEPGKFAPTVICNRGTTVTFLYRALAEDDAVDAGSYKVYDMHVENAASNINFDMTVKISVSANTLTWEVTELTKAEDCAKIVTIDIPQLNLLTVDATETDSVFAGAQASTTTTSKADTYITFDDGFVPSSEDGYLYAFLTNGKLSAGLHSNSEKEGDKRIERINGADTMSLTSATWYYEAGDSTGQAVASVYDYQVSELPQAKVAIADGDLNGDNDIDWNDGAIAYRDIMHYAQGSEAVKDMVNYRIVMNFESAATNPFLVTADNVKKVYLATDGLPQALLLKGYGNEGHDSANSEYADIGERLGGVDDFQDLLKIAHQYNTEVGIHVNAQEAYPEAKSFNETMVSSAYGVLNGNGWGWLDQSVVINKLWDLSSSARLKRFVQLYDRINETDFLSLDWDDGEYVKDSQGILTNGDGETEVSRTELLELVKANAATQEDNMDFIYLDVWYQDAWETRRIAEEINSLGWRFSTEFSAEGEYDSTWQHWSTDTTYGGAGAKGYNSDIIRFLRNDNRDSQVLNWPNFGGTADNPLLGGFRLYGFEGWGGDQDYNNYIWGTFDENLPTKFLQHYEVIDWENYGDDGSDEVSPVGNTEKQITLANDEGDVVVVTRNEEQRSDIEIERTITLNGKVVLNTDVDSSEYLLPWTDNQTGDEKLYHWNLDGGTTTWDLQDDWAKLANVVVYELSDQGRINGQTIEVVDGTLTLTAEESVPYVVVKGEELKELKADFGEYDYVADPGFNGYADGEKLDAADWSGDIDADGVAIAVSSYGDQRLRMTNTDKDVAVTTKISGLTAGEYYVAEAYVDNESDVKATISVNNGETVVSNYTERSFVRNSVSSDSEHGTNMQRMQISFVATGTTAELTLAREAGTGYTDWEDIRIVNKKVDNYKEDGSFVQDFESVVQGLYPFVLGYYTGGDSCTHLSQLNAPYTQAGWNGRVIDDVIDGEWSLKHHTIATGIVYQTIPQNFRFEAGKAYIVEFDYQTGSEGYNMVVGDGKSYTAPTTYLPIAAGETKHVTMEVVGSGTGQTWIGLYQKGSLCGTTSTGKGDFVLDNLVITEAANAEVVTVSATNLLLGEIADIAGSGLENITWTASEDGIVSVDTDNNQIVSIGAGTVTLTAAFPSGKTVEFTITVEDEVVEDISRDLYPSIASSANTEEDVPGNEPDGSGVASAAADGDSSTYWHSNWSTGFNVSASNPAVLTVDLGTTVEFGGFKFQQRPSGGNNGMVQAYSYRILDADGNVVASGDNVAVDSASQASSEWIVQKLGQTVNAKVIEISVTSGYNNFAAIAEVVPVNVTKITLN